MYVRCRLLDRQLLQARARRQSRRRRRRSSVVSKKKKRTRRVAGDRWSLFLSTRDNWMNPGCVVYGIRLEVEESVVRPSAEPLVRWSDKDYRYSALAAAGTTTILALIGSRTTLVHHVATGTDTPGPRLRRSKRRPAMLGTGDDTVLVMDRDVAPDRCCFEALRRDPGSGGWRAEALPDPPLSFLDASGTYFCYPYVSAYFARGSRAWISVPDKGTFSLDMERRTWREEGTWELPLYGRGLFAPELGVVIGIARIIFFQPTDECCQVCALDVAARPPVARRVWQIPPEEGVHRVAMYETSCDLAHLGNGRFCISRSVVVDVDGRTAQGRWCDMNATYFTLVDVSLLPGTGDLHLAKHAKSHCHVWPLGHSGNTDFIQPA